MILASLHPIISIMNRSDGAVNVHLVTSQLPSEKQRTLPIYLECGSGCKLWDRVCSVSNAHGKEGERCAYGSLQRAETVLNEIRAKESAAHRERIGHLLGKIIR